MIKFAHIGDRYVNPEAIVWIAPSGGMTRVRFRDGSHLELTMTVDQVIQAIREAR